MTDSGLPALSESIAALVIMSSPLLFVLLIWIMRRRKARARAVAQEQEARAAVHAHAEAAEAGTGVPGVPPGPAKPPTGADQTAPVTESLGARIGNWIGAALLALLFVRLAVALVVWCIPDFRMLPPSLPKLAQQVGDYLRIDGLKRDVSGAMLQGKAVIIDTDKGALHPLMRGLPKSIRATEPGEVDLVIWVDSERVADPESEVRAVAAPTPDQFAGKRLSQGIPVDCISIPVYRAKWTVTVIDFNKKEIKSTKSFVGPSLPDGEIDFRSPPLSGQHCIFVDGKMAKGAEALFGKDGRVLIGSKYLIGVVGPTPWDETLKWIGELIGP